MCTNVPEVILVLKFQVMLVLKFLARLEENAGLAPCIYAFPQRRAKGGREREE